MNNWEFLFEKKILDRGYFITDDVEIVTRSLMKVSAVVSGTFEYDVEISFDEYGYVDSMSCTCPYFERDNCKHLAALLYCLENDEFEDSGVDIDELFESVDDNKLKEFLFDELIVNSQLKNKFIMKFSINVDENYYKSKLDDIIYEDDFSYELSYFINEDIGLLLDRKEYDLILDLMDDAFISVCSQFEYPWNDMYYDNLNEIYGVLSKLMDSEACDDVFEWLMSAVRYKCREDYIYKFSKLLFCNFKLKYQLKEKYKLIDNILPTVSSFYRQSYILFKIRLMRDLDCPQSEIDKFRLENIIYPQVRQQFINESLDEGDYSKAIRLIEKGISQSKYSYDKHNFQIQLKDLYLKTGDLDNYKRELFDIIIEYEDIDDYMELKKHYSKDEWMDVREDIFIKCDVNSFLNECYANEGLYDRLIDNICYEADLSYYRNRLSKNYSKDLLEKYSLFVNRKASSTGTRKHYRSIVKLLNEMLTIPDGDKVVHKIFDEWKVKYKNRPAMWDEFQKVRLNE